MAQPAKILQIGNYPPPMCGWAIQLYLVTQELRRRGHICEVLKINEGRRIKDSSYIDVQNGLDYLLKVVRHAVRRYRLNVHVNGMSKKGYQLALIAALAGRFAGRPALVTFHGGLSQDYFPRYQGGWYRAFRLLFRLAGGIACDSEPIREAIVSYGIAPGKVVSIETFSAQYVQFTPAPLPVAVQEFLRAHNPVIFSYVSFRPEYRLEVLREAMRLYRQSHPKAGFIWLGFPGKEFPAAQEMVGRWPEEERNSLLLLGNLSHDEFLTLLSRSTICLRTPACDGVSASVLESLALGVPVVASANGRRPAGVITYQDESARDMCDRLLDVTRRHEQIRTGLKADVSGDNVSAMADWLADEKTVETRLAASGDGASPVST
jgi:glycosyltransferase involved in cell wall biosynthesis